jgi:hypothetical protein
VSERRPKWAEALRMFVTDEIIDERYGYPAGGSADELHGRIEEAVNAILCNAYGHEIIDDHCGIPAHRFCIYCNRRESAIGVDEPSRSDVLDGHAGTTTEHEVASPPPPGQPTGQAEQAGLQGEPTTSPRPPQVSR